MTAHPDLGRDPRAMRVRKKRIVREVRFAREDGVCETLEGPIRYRRRDAIVEGEHGERWPVARAVFLDTYCPLRPETAGRDGPYVSQPTEALAVQLREATSVRAGGEDDRLLGQPGDWIIQYERNAWSIVREDIFALTYDIMS